MKSPTVLRVARPTNDLDAVVGFYRDGLGLQELYRFENHAGFDGVMLGRRGRRTISSSLAGVDTMQAERRPRITLWPSIFQIAPIGMLPSRA